MLACLLACRELVERYEASFRGWSQLSGELGFSDTPSGIRELRPPVGTYADDPSQNGIESALLEVDAGPIAATQHHSRLRAPARQLGCRRDQRLLPWRVISPIAPASHRSGSASSRNSTPEENCKPGVQLSAWNTAPPDISLRAMTTQAIRLEYGTALSKVCLSYCQPGVKQSAWNTAPQDIR